MKKIYDCMKRLTVVLCLVVLVSGLVACKNDAVTTGNVGIQHETKFNTAYVLVTNDQMKEFGFKFGDSCNVEFSNGVKFSDIPYYNGYYVAKGELLICGYPGYPYIVVTRNNSSDFWDGNAFTEEMTAKITLNERAKYIRTQEALSLTYKTERSAYPNETDAQFANFREITAGNIKSGVLYRGASPFDNQYNRADYVDRLLREYQVKFILDLADSESELAAYEESRDFTNHYAIEQKKALLDLASDYSSETYKTSVGCGLKQMIDSEGPYFIHCTEGKDRTGFVCTLLEGLCGATYEEMCHDYMITYENYYEIQAGDSRYSAVVDILFNEFWYNLAGSHELENCDYSSCARKYLTSCGLTDGEIDRLIDILTK